MINFLFNRTPLHFMTQSLWRDEAFSYLLAKKNIIEIISLTGQDFNPPFYYIILHFWIILFGKSEIALRSLSFIFFVLTIYVVSLFLDHIIIQVHKKRKWIYLSLFALNPALLYYAFEARMYSMYAFIATLSFYFFLRKKRAPYIMVSIIGLYTHYFFVFVIATQITFQAIMYRKRFFKKCLYMIIPFLGFLPWFFYVYPQFLAHTADFWISKTTSADLIQSIGTLFTGYEPVYTYYNYFIVALSLFLITLIISLSIRYFHHYKKKYNLFIFLALWSFLSYIGILIVSFFIPLFLFRYLIFVPVGFSLFLSFLLEKTRRRTFFIYVMILFIMSIHYTALESLYKRKGDVRKTIREIKAIAGKNDLIYVADPTLYFTTVYYFDEKKVWIYDPESIPHYIGRVLISDDKITRQLAIFPQKTFILTNDTNYEIRSIQ